MTLPEGFTTPFDGLAETLANTPPEVSIRLNPAKPAPIPGADTAGRVAWCAEGLYAADTRPQFTFDPLMHQGAYYVQDASSMIYAHIVGLIADATGGVPLACLDSCAAPGGKTTAAIASLPAGSLMVANEYVGARAEVLRENLAKWGNAATVVTTGDTAIWRRFAEVFDVVTADVPCSGEGMFRKDSQAVAQWSPGLVAECSARQREITANVWEALRPGGYMIYSTCTFNRAENQDIVSYLQSELGAETIPLRFPESWHVTECDGCHHFLPGRVRGEGLTVALLRKPSDTPRPDWGSAARIGADRSGRRVSPAKARKKATAPAGADTSACAAWLADPGSFVLATSADASTVSAIPAHWEGLISRIRNSHPGVLSAGIEMAAIRGRDLVPQQALALSTAYRRGAFPEAEVGYADAVAYLRREAVTLPDAVPTGIVLLTYAGLPLGFVKNLGRRANNLYPAPWRILSAHVPDAPPRLF